MLVVYRICDSGLVLGFRGDQYFLRPFLANGFTHNDIVLEHLENICGAFFHADSAGGTFIVVHLGDAVYHGDTLLGTLLDADSTAAAYVL